MKKSFTILLVVFSLFFSLSQVLAAQNCPPPGQGIISICNPLGSESFEDLINNLINWVFNIALVVVPLMLIFAAFKFVTSEGKPEAVQQATDLIWWAVIGFVIILLAKGLVTLLKNILGVTTI